MINFAISFFNHRHNQEINRKFKKTKQTTGVKSNFKRVLAISHLNFLSFCSLTCKLGVMTSISQRWIKYMQAVGMFQGNTGVVC